MMRLRIWFCCLLIAGINLNTSTTLAQDEPLLEQIAIYGVASLFENDYLTYSTLSPDGTTLAWSENWQLCFLTLLDSDQVCYDLPFADDIYREHIYSQFSSFTWSPDSQHIAVSGFQYGTPLDFDIWLFTLTSREFVNLTEDFANLAFNPETGEIYDANVDHFPMWSPSAEGIYFFRAQVTSATERVEALYHLDLNGGETELITDFEGQSMLISEAASVSPDGQQIVLVLHGSNDDEQSAEIAGLWLLDLHSKELEKLATYDAFMAAMPEWVNSHRIDNVHWAGDHIIVEVAGYRFGDDNTLDLRIIMRNYYSLYIPTKQIVPLIDESNVPLDAVVNNEFLMPSSGTLTSDGTLFFYLRLTPGIHGSREQTSLWVVTTDFNTHQLIDDLVPNNYAPPEQLSLDNRERVLVGQLLLTFERSE